MNILGLFKIIVHKALFEENKLCNFIMTLYLRYGKVKGKISKIVLLYPD